MSWDYVVVGAGSAGAALAARLTERSSVRVLLVEAGPDWRPDDAPATVRQPNPFPLFVDPWFKEVNWGGVQARRSSVQGPAPYPRGRGLGGSSTINGQYAIRPEPADFDDWPAGWSWDEVLGSLCRLERDRQFGDKPYHGASGPIPITRPDEADWGVVDLAVRDAAVGEYGWEPDHNAPGSAGVSPYAFNADERGRVTTNDAYIEPARHRGNLEIMCDTLVSRVRVESGRCVGVETADGRLLEAGEVVLCAGAVHSPAILLRSGIGPAESVRGIGLQPVADLPVGRGLQDHAMLAVAFQLDQARSLGPRTRHGSLCIRYTSGHEPAGVNDMMIVAANAASFPGIGFVAVWVNRVFSRGRILLDSADPWQDPLVEQEMLSDPQDLVRAVDGVRRLCRLVRHDAFDGVAGPPTLTDGTSAADMEAMSDEDLGRLLAPIVVDTQHACGTCAIGDPNGSATVVDPACRVLGIEGLRVADASIFPAVPRANTHLTAVMVGERLADLL